MTQRLRRSVKVLSTGANILIFALSVIIAPYILFVGSFWGAPLWELVIQIFFVCGLPIAAIPFSTLRADRLRWSDRIADAELMRFLPVLLFFAVGPIVFLLIRLVAIAVAR